MHRARVTEPELDRRFILSYALLVELRNRVAIVHPVGARSDGLSIEFHRYDVSRGRLFSQRK